MIALAMSGATATMAFQTPIFARQVRNPSRTAISMAQPSVGTGSGKGLQYNPDKYTDEKNKGNYRKLSEALEVSTNYTGSTFRYFSGSPIRYIWCSQDS